MSALRAFVTEPARSRRRLFILLVNNPRVFPSNRGHSAPKSVLARGAVRPYFRRSVGFGCAHILGAVSGLRRGQRHHSRFWHLPLCFGSSAWPPLAERNGTGNTGKNVYLPPLQICPQKALKTGCEILSAGCLSACPHKIAHRGSRWRTRRLGAVSSTQKQARLHLPPALTCIRC